MGWFDPINWRTEKTYCLAEIDAVYTHFEETLNAAQFDHVKVVNEWHNFRKYVSTSLPNHAAVELWVKIFQFKKNEYPQPLHAGQTYHNDFRFQFCSGARIQYT